MRRVRNTVVTCLVWATAVSMLVASTPHFVCRCPNGDIKPFCLASTFTKSSCCNVTCCSSESGGSNSSKAKPGGKSCCARKNTFGNAPDKGNRTDDRNSSPAFGKTCCQKVLVQSEGSSLNSSETKLTPSSPILDLSGATAAENAVAPSILLLARWRFDRLPPPTDLVTTLQRLTI
jgi:hypothetical protein